MQMPRSWTESLLKKMTALYGERFLNQWRNVEPEDMIGTWSDALGPYCDIGQDGQGQRIKWALDQLAANNPYPPTLPEFVALCRQAPRPQVKALPEPTVSDEQAAENLREIDGMARKMAGERRDFIAWARTPPERDLRGPWEKAICDCVENGDDRFRLILAKHYEDGIVKSERAGRLLGVTVDDMEAE